MAECAEVVHLLYDYLNRELPAETCSLLEEHLQSCAACRDAATALRTTVALCRQFRSEDKPGQLAEEHRRELREAFSRVLQKMGSGEADF